MNIAAHLQELERATTIRAVRSRLMVVSATLHGSATGTTQTPPDLLRHLAAELHAIAASMDVWLQDLTE